MYKLRNLIGALLLTLACASCVKQAQQDYIAGNDYKLWKKVDKDEQHRGVGTYYYFNKSGKFQIYKKYRNSDKLEKLDMGDVVLIEEWKLLGNNIISIAGRKDSIISLTDKLYIFKGIERFKDTTTLVYNGDVLP